MRSVVLLLFGLLCLCSSKCDDVKQAPPTILINTVDACSVLKTLLNNQETNALDCINLDIDGYSTLIQEFRKLNMEVAPPLSLNLDIIPKQNPALARPDSASDVFSGILSNLESGIKVDLADFPTNIYREITSYIQNKLNKEIDERIYNTQAGSKPVPVSDNDVVPDSRPILPPVNNQQDIVDPYRDYQDGSLLNLPRKLEVRTINLKQSKTSEKKRSISVPSALNLDETQKNDLLQTIFDNLEIELDSLSVEKVQVDKTLHGLSLPSILSYAVKVPSELLVNESNSAGENNENLGFDSFPTYYNIGAPDRSNVGYLPESNDSPHPPPVGKADYTKEFFPLISDSKSRVKETSKINIQEYRNDIQNSLYSPVV